MFKEYVILEIDDSVLSYRVKYKYQILKFCGADSKMKPIYTLVKQERNLQKAEEYILKHVRST